MEPAPAPWPLAARLAFRFAIVYFVLLIWPFPLNLIPGAGERVEAWTSRPLVTWAARDVLRLDRPIEWVETGSGAKAGHYVWAGCAAALAAVAAAAWSLLGRRTRSHPRLLAWLRVAVRSYLGFFMLVYGCVKLVPSQFQAMPLDKLLQGYGEASPMGLLWVFMGHSRAYAAFTGAAEALAGSLLLFRRTALLGALLAAGVLANVVMLNFCFDVPVKLFSSHLLAMALLLLLPDLGRLASVLLLHRAVPAAEPPPLFEGKWSRHSSVALSSVLLLGTAGVTLGMAYGGYTTAGAGGPRSPLRGVWAVEEFEIDGQVRPPLLTDPDRWSPVTFDNTRFVVVRDMRNRRRFYGVTLDEAARTVALSQRGDGGSRAALTYERPEFAALVLTGEADGRPVRVRLRRRDESEFPLISRGFHWVSEAPFNR